MPIKSGFYRESLFDYIQGEGINRSFLQEMIDKSPAHAKFKQEHEEITDALRFGDAFHAAGLQPKRFEQEYVILPQDCKPGSGEGMKSRKEAFVADAEAKSQTIIQPDDQENIKKMIAVIRAEKEAVDLLSDGEAEMSGYFVDPDYDVLVKIRLDYINKKQGIITDLKSCADARLALFRTMAFDKGYDLQAFMGLYGVTQITGQAHSDFRFICVEKQKKKESRNYTGLKIYIADQEMLDTGYKKYQRAMELYKKCKEKDQWPGYTPVIEPLGSPDWAKNKIMACWEN